MRMQRTFKGLLVVVMMISVIVASAALTSCAPADPAEETHLVVEDALILGTVVTIRAHAPRDPEVLASQVREVIEAMEELGCSLSVYCEDSETVRVNEAGGRTVEVSPDFERILGYALEVAERTGGVFDPSVGPLVELWGFYSGKYRVPEEEEIAEALERVDWRRIRLEDGSVTIESGMQLDIEALLKGYIADFALAELEDLEVTGALVIAGPSSIAALGAAQGGRPWKVGLENPRDPGNIYGAVELADGEHISTSGDYQRYFIDESGQRRSHILDARTGKPVEGLMAATVISDSSLGTDGISTAVLPLDAEEAIALLEDWRGVDALVITADREILFSGDMERRVEMTADGL